ncbi:bifunctional oligoribonuclease/PAP phosphatase NrnA [bacterium]|nr:bifunctional oligoribonuclease/PAP phosphatase NrnA [bacterium]
MSSDLEREYQAAIELFQQAESVAVFSHVGPDPDAYGSSCAMAIFLEELAVHQGRSLDVVVVNEDAEAARLDFIPRSQQVMTTPESESAIDLVVVCDCGEQHRVGETLDQWISESGLPRISIDHHQSNPLFGDVNIVDTEMSSTCELLYDLFAFWRAAAPGKVPECSPLLADCLLAGILGDTGGFRYRSTGAGTLEKAASLLEHGARLPFLSQELFGSTPLSTVQLNARAVEKMRLFADGRIAGVCLTHEDYDAVGAGDGDVEGLVELLRDIEGVEISYTIRAVEDRWKASLRTGRDDVDLSVIAQSFGGGGHRAASAFRASGSVSELISRLEKLLTEALEAADAPNSSSAHG